MSECKLKIGITQGDPNGIGWEVILKALSDPRMTELFTPVVYGSPAAAAYYRNTLGDTEPVAFNTVPAARDTRRGKATLWSLTAPMSSLSPAASLAQTAASAAPTP